MKLLCGFCFGMRFGAIVGKDQLAEFGMMGLAAIGT